MTRSLSRTASLAIAGGMLATALPLASAAAAPTSATPGQCRPDHAHVRRVRLHPARGPDLLDLRRPAERPGAHPEPRRVGCAPADQPRRHPDRARARQGALHGPQLRVPHSPEVLRRHELPPPHGIHDSAGGTLGPPVRRPPRDGLGRPGLRVQGRARLGQPARELARLPRREPQGLPARDPRHGQRRPRHQRQPVLPRLRGLAPAPGLHGLRARERRGHEGPRHDRGRRHRPRHRRHDEDGAPAIGATILRAKRTGPGH